MLTKPALDDIKISTAFEASYGLQPEKTLFLPLGADANSAAYRITVPGGIEYFLKLRRGKFEETSAALPAFLAGQGVDVILAPIKTLDGCLWMRVDTYTGVLYPFVHGSDALARPLTEPQWAVFGAALKRIHSLKLPPGLKANLRHEDYSSVWRRKTLAYTYREAGQWPHNDMGRKLASLFQAKRDEILALVSRTEELAGLLRASKPQEVLCHGDVFAANLFIAENSHVYIVDWDNPLLAPKERDLMYIGAGICGLWSTAEENSLFYRGYGDTRVDPMGICYYRYERIIADIAAFPEEILDASAGEADCERSLEFLESNFRPGSVLDVARETDRLWLDQ